MAMNIGESTNSMTAGHGWLIAKCYYEVWMVSTAVLDVSLHETLYSADHQLANPSAHPRMMEGENLPNLFGVVTLGSPGSHNSFRQ
jgi:hypothetical protein